MKKGEIQMQETILVIFIITVIIALGLFVFYRYNLSSLENERLNYEQEKVYALLSNLQNNPQLQYSYLGNNENAVDTLKLLNVNLEDLGEKEIAIVCGPGFEKWTPKNMENGMVLALGLLAVPAYTVMLGSVVVISQMVLKFVRDHNAIKSESEDADGK